MRLAIALALAVSVAGCKGDKTAPKPDPKPADKPIDAAVTVADAAGGHEKADVPAEQRKAYREHVRSGRELAKQDQWGAAVVEFEAALEAIEGDARALSELSWAAFQAGDHPKARKAGADSVRVATDPNVKAASLYNLGRVAEATGDRDDAADYYRESLKLRSNATVSKRLRTLVGAVDDPWKLDSSMLPCQEPRPLDKMCECLENARKEDYEFGEFSCDSDVAADAVWGLIKTTHGYGDVYVNLVARGDSGWGLAAELEQVYNPGVAGVWEELNKVDVHQMPRGSNKILWAEVEKFHADTDPGINEEESIGTVRLTVCIVGGPRGVSCAFQAPISEDYSRGILFDDAEHESDVGDMHTPGLPISRKGTLKADLDDKGILNVSLADGELTPLLAPYVGRHALW